MRTVAGIFGSQETAAQGLQRLRGIGVREDAINVLMPGASERQLASVATDDGEQPGMGAAIGAVAGQRYIPVVGGYYLPISASYTLQVAQS